jgi:hypothetical protein
VAVDLQLNAVGRAIRQPQRSGGEILLGTVDATGNVTVAPGVPINTAARLSYNPKTYGAAFDNVTDDLDAWNAMFADMAAHAPNAATGYLIEIPIGLSFVRDSVIPTRQFVLVGHGGGGSHDVSGIRGAAGKTPLVVSGGTTVGNYPVPPVGSDGSYSRIEDVDLISTELIPQHTNAYSLNCGVNVHRASCTAYERGFCAVYLLGANYGNGGATLGYFFRVIANTGDKKTVCGRSRDRMTLIRCPSQKPPA